ncbi:SIMPL domain-containing protein [Flagellimonas sp. HMM57]|uniref:SIMPL domain-containing protein n=1 Tax=unclassified Flagellimonas TaxID=2644544 RepID=UPI0013D51522|nr:MULTISPECIES: SIMPL domain-containing protein [unclassified Flagellimonas]UII76527.1 SIMPL domain-containing protein [Flagellimonas sp. HMM57]
MKKIILIIMVLTTMIMRSQNSTDHRNTVSVSGKALVENSSKTYKAKIVLNMGQVRYSNPDCKTLKELKEKFFDKLKANGFEPSSFKEDMMGFIAYGYQNDGTVFDFESSDFEKIMALTKVRMIGASTTVEFKSSVSETEHKSLLKKAVEDAKKNATLVCGVINKKLGGVVSISENFTNNGIWYSYYNGNKDYLTVQVVYEID